MKDFYTAFYAAVEYSPAHALFCERVFGRNLSQHRFADLRQLELLLQAVPIISDQKVLELGCGNGLVSEYLSDRTGAHVTGLDYIPGAVDQARRRTAVKSNRLVPSTPKGRCLSMKNVMAMRKGSAGPSRKDCMPAISTKSDQ